MKKKIALQLFSLRDDIQNDLEGTLQFIKDAGFDGVEFCGFYGRTPKELNDLFKKYQLTPISAHVDIDKFVYDGIDFMLDQYVQTDCKYIAIPWLEKERWPNHPRFDETIDSIKEIGEAVNKVEKRLLYHNHWFEFDKIEDEYALDYIYRTISEELLGCELDCCWVDINSGALSEYISKYADRSPVIHLKNYHISRELIKECKDAGTLPNEHESFEFRPLDDGCINYNNILEQINKTDIEWLIIEQDNPTPGKTAKECIKQSIDYLKSKI